MYETVLTLKVSRRIVTMQVTKKGTKMIAVCCTVAAEITRRALRVRHIVTSFVAPRSSLYFSILSHNGAIFGNKSLNIKCVVWFYL
jgi:hypothetical protein